MARHLAPELTFFAEFAKVDDDQQQVFGWASTETQDKQGETVLRSAVENALPGYMLWKNIREMHQPSAVGTAIEANMEPKGLWLGAQVIDDRAWKKVKTGVYKGFSIGGRVTGRDPNNKKIITGIDLTEISLVDRPANPDAKFELVKRDDGKLRMQPIQIWACGCPEHQHLAKAEAGACMTDRAEELHKREFSTEQREHLSDTGEAMEDGSFLIANRHDLKNAITAHGRAKDPEKAKAHIIARAKAMGAESDLPEDWLAKFDPDHVASGPGGGQFTSAGASAAPVPKPQSAPASAPSGPANASAAWHQIHVAAASAGHGGSKGKSGHSAGQHGSTGHHSAGHHSGGHGHRVHKMFDDPEEMTKATPRGVKTPQFLGHAAAAEEARDLSRDCLDKAVECDKLAASHELLAGESSKAGNHPAMLMHKKLAQGHLSMAERHRQHAKDYVDLADRHDNDLKKVDADALWQAIREGEEALKAVA